MPKAKSFITTLIFIILLAFDCFGHAVVTEFTVLSWQEVEINKLEIKIIDSKDIEKIVHIRFNPDRVALLIQDKNKRSSAEQQYNEAFALLKKQLHQSTKINVWLYSDKGFIPIENRPGHYRTDWMYIPSWDKEKEQVCLVASDLGLISPD